MNSPISPDLDPATSPLRSVHTTNFPAILKHLGISLVVSTYQAGKVIILRADGETLNTHFRLFNRPMGLAGDREKLAIGTAFQIIDLRNVPDTAAKLNPPGKHDACYLPRNIHITGDIDIHEMAWADNELWFVNTRFSCLCTLEHPNSFVPRWRPPFVTAYDLTDRCHLNGLGLRDGKPKYVTALGETDTPAGWRQNKVNGGILMDIDTNEILVRGISMPHSPRWYEEQLWVLESGKGSLSTVDLNAEKLTTVAQLPGFTRGIEFWGNIAFIGLSQVRETAVFSGLEIAQNPERTCGVWVVNIQTGEILAFLRFEDGVQEIFAISVLPNTVFPEILEWDESLLASTYILPDEALAQTVKPTTENIAAEQHFARGNELYNQSKLQEAATEYQACLQIKPDFLRARYNLGVVLGDLDQYPAAVEQLEQVIAVEPHHAEAHNSLGYVYSKQRVLEKAIEHYGEAVKLDGSYAKAHFNLGMNLLQAGEFEQGWAECEWRWKTPEFTSFNCPQPRWDGEDLAGKTLLIHTEQGAGDAIQFIRYIPMAARWCRKLILVCTPQLMTLFETVDGIDKIINAGTLELKEFDVYLPLMSLPYIFNTTLETIPADIPYLYIPESQDLPVLPSHKKTKTFKVGIAWAGSPT
ncbi:MAG: TIGR03032 family protein, partial [Cyanobacteriota bacterium]|nr:TIGR03032 family protein [Cyanobacteriota bacterium]